MIRLLRIWAPPALALVVILGSSAESQAETIRITALEAGDTVVIKMWSWGCFHYRAKYLFTFNLDPKQAGHVLVTVKDIKGVWHRSLGVRSLGPDELRGLDAVLSAYRVPVGRCISSTLHRVRLKWVDEGEVISEEMHFGSPCIESMVAGGLSLSEIASDFGTPGPRSQADGYFRPNNRMQAPAGGLGGGITRDGRAPAAPDAERSAAGKNARGQDLR